MPILESLRQLLSYIFNPLSSCIRRRSHSRYQEITADAGINPAETQVVINSSFSSSSSSASSSAASSITTSIPNTGIDEGESTTLLAKSKEPAESKCWRGFRTSMSALSAILAALPPFISMTTLSAGAMGIMFNVKDPSFLNTWKDATGQPVDTRKFFLAFLTVLFNGLSILAMSPFNAFNTFGSTKNILENLKGIIDSMTHHKPLNDYQRTCLQYITQYTDNVLIAALIPFAGGPIGVFTKGGLHDMTVDNPIVLRATYCVATIFSGWPIASAINYFATKEVPGMFRTYGSFVSNCGKGILAQARNGSLPEPGKIDSETALSILLTMYSHAKDVLQTHPSSAFGAIDSKTAATEIAARVIIHRPDYAMARIAVLEMLFAFTGYLVGKGSELFGPLGETSVAEICSMFGKEPSPFLTELGHVLSESSFFALWFLLIKDLWRNAISLIPAPHTENTGAVASSSVKDNVLRVSGVVFGLALGLTNFPLTDQWVNRICAFLSNAAVSANGFGGGLEQMGLIKQTHGAKLIDSMEQAISQITARRLPADTVQIMYAALFESVKQARVNISFVFQDDVSHDDVSHDEDLLLPSPSHA